MHQVARQICGIVLGVSVLVAVFTTVSAQMLPATFMAATPVSTPQSAVQEAVQTGGEVYAGDCAATTPANIGQDCSKYVADRGALQAYLVGRAFSEYSDWLFVQLTSEGWVPLSSAAFDDSARSLVIPWPSAP